MKVSTTLRINMTGPATSPETQGERYRAAIEMAAFADRHGFTRVPAAATVGRHRPRQRALKSR